jgi:hypothetical protein
MDSALKDPRSTGPCLIAGCGKLILFFSRHQTLLHQFQRDENVRTLLTTIRDSFEFTKEADVLRNIRVGSAQAQILDEMLQCVSNSAEFIESYAKDVQVGMLS